MNKIKTLSTLCFGLVALSLLNGCATIMNGTTQTIGISSNPSGADISVDQLLIGKTPLVTDLTRKKDHIVKLELKGYEPYEIAFSRKASGWVWGNLVVGGLIGLAVDAISGGLYILTPEQIQAEMRKETIACYNGTDQLCLFFTLEPQADWTKAGQLTAKQ